MARPRTRANQGLPQNLLCRRRKRASGQVVEYFYYVLSDGKEKSLGTDKYEAVLEAAKLNFEYKKKSDVVLFVDVVKRYEVEIVPTKAKNTRNANLRAIRWLCKFFGDPVFPIEKIEPKHIKMYLQWRKDVPQAANNEITLFNTIWNAAREWGYTEKMSPSIGVTRHAKSKRDVYIESYLLDKLREFADQQMKDMLDLAYLIGQRPIDLCNIHRSHIYDGILHISQQKTKAKVRFQISGKLKEIIDRRLAGTSQWLFSNKWGRKLNRNNLTNYFFILRKKTISAYPELENELNNIQFRDLRAKAATDIYLSQSIENAQKHLGHTDSKMTKRYIRKDKLLKPIDVISE